MLITYYLLQKPVPLWEHKVTDVYVFVKGDILSTYHHKVSFVVNFNTWMATCRYIGTCPSMDVSFPYYSLFCIPITDMNTAAHQHQLVYLFSQVFHVWL